MFLPMALTTPALIGTIRLIDEDADLKGMPLESIHKEALATLKKAGYKRTRVEEDKTAIIGSATEVDLLSPDGKEKITLTFYTEDDSTVERVTPVPEGKAAAAARYGPLLKEKFPSVKLLCYEVRGKTYAAVKKEVSEATPKNVVEALEETKKAIALVEESRGAATTPVSTPASPLETVLIDAKISYSDGGRFYQLKYNFSDTKRSQTGFIRKEVYTFNSLKVQELFSLCYDKPEPPSAELLQSVFQKRFNIGGLILEAPSPTQPNWRIRFHMDVPTALSAERLKTYLQLVQGTADTLEKELNPGSEDKL